MQGLSTGQSIVFCNLSDLRKTGHITKWVDELRDEITAVYFDGHIVVFSSVCPHFGGEMEVDFKNRCFKCKWHAWKFCLNSGECKSHGFSARLRKYSYLANNDDLILLA